MAIIQDRGNVDIKNTWSPFHLIWVNGQVFASTAVSGMLIAKPCPDCNS